MDQLIEKLMKSKVIMEKSDQIKRGSPMINMGNEIPELSNFDSPNAKYNIPQEFVTESQKPQMKSPASQPKIPTTDAIIKSKLPDEIKKLMMERPIVPPQMQASPTLSNELVEKASRLMKENNNNYVPDSAKLKSSPQTQSTTNFDYNVLRQIVKEVVEESLKENGLISESTEKSNETFSFKVGKHVFEGKVTKIKKLS